jgi:hypothetical protein
VAVIVLGLASRSGLATRLHVPKDVGDVLYAVMAFLLAALAMPRASSLQVAGFAFLYCLLIEAFKLVPGPSLDSLRQSLPGRLLLGHDFSVLDIVDYVLGVLIGVGFDLLIGRPISQDS